MSRKEIDMLDYEDGVPLNEYLPKRKRFIKADLKEYLRSALLYSQYKQTKNKALMEGLPVGVVDEIYEEHEELFEGFKEVEDELYEEWRRELESLEYHAEFDSVNILKEKEIKDEQG